MGKRITQGRGRSKKKEIFFNFNRLRQTLSSEEKEKIKSFFTKFRPVFKEVQNNLFKLNQKFDSLEVQVKNFQQNYIKDTSIHQETEDFVLNEDDINQLLNSTEKKSPNKKYEDYKDNFFDKEEEEEQQPQRINTVEGKGELQQNYSEKYFDYKKFQSGKKIINANDSKVNRNNQNSFNINKMLPTPGKDFRQGTLSNGLRREGGEWINKN